jgi:hypothetical protein
VEPATQRDLIAILADAHVLSEQAGLARAQAAGALATPASLISWLEATTPPFFVAFRAIVGLGADAREQAMRDQHMLRFAMASGHVRSTPGLKYSRRLSELLALVALVN